MRGVVDTICGMEFWYMEIYQRNWKDLVG